MRPFTGLLGYVTFGGWQFEQIALRRIVLCKRGRIFTSRRIFHLGPHGWFEKYTY